MHAGIRNVGAAALAVGLVATLAGGGCASRLVTVREIEHPSAPGWVGHTRAELERAWGRPSERQPDGEGGTILVYRKERAFKVETADDPRTPGWDPQPTTDPDLNRYVSGRFWIDPEGRIYRFWINPGYWDKAPAPPSSAPSDAAGATGG